jgi:hypothetical protein
MSSGEIGPNELRSPPRLARAMPDVSEAASADHAHLRDVPARSCTGVAALATDGGGETVRPCCCRSSQASTRGDIQRTSWRPPPGPPAWRPRPWREIQAPSAAAVIFRAILLLRMVRFVSPPPLGPSEHGHRLPFAASTPNSGRKLSELSDLGRRRYRRAPERDPADKVVPWISLRVRVQVNVPSRPGSAA